MVRNWCGFGRGGGRHRSMAMKKRVHVEGHTAHGIVKTSMGLVEVAGGHEDQQ